ncbi:MAG: siderophore-interacting protein [Roseobacter sp.]
MVVSTAPRKTPIGTLMSVKSTKRLTPNMIRVTLTAPNVATFSPECAGGHCKLFFADHGQSRDAFEDQLANGPRPVARTYTVRHARLEREEIDIDFVAHGDEGVASAWAEAAAPGSFCGFAGPGAPKLIDFDADWYFIAADMSGLPVAAAALEALPSNAKGVAVFEITSPEDRQKITGPTGVAQHWILHSDPHQESQGQLDFAKNLEWPSGSVRTMIAGETEVVRALRLLTRGDLGVDRKRSYASGYWRIGMAEDAHQKVKREEAEKDERVLNRV